MSINYLDKILQAKVYDVANKTPLELATKLSQRLNNQIWLKREDLQPVFSFKLRGAYNKIIQLSEKDRQKGIIAASAGNHAQGVALAAQKIGIPALIVMPKTTPGIKVEAVKYLGAKIILHGNSYDDAFDHAKNIERSDGLIFIHPYDDPDVIAGQGTVAMEMMQQRAQGFDAIFVPVGGGGLIAGIAAYIKALAPQIKIIGVEAGDSACLKAALDHQERVVLDQVGIFADGVAVKQIGKEPFNIVRDKIDDMVLVTSDEICASIKDIFDETRSITEPAGALAVAGIKKYIEQNQINKQSFAAIVSGANMNFDRLRHVAERAELGKQREALLAVSVDEKPGSFHRFCHIIGQRGITEFNYRFADPKIAHVFAGIQLREGNKEKETLIAKLEDHDYQVLDISDDDVAKLHIRYMVGGHAPGLTDEIIYRFEFPERPGALLLFLTKIGQRWNISMFHYRNHGADFGRTLVGIQVPPNEKIEFDRFLEELAYQYWDETENPVYKLFLG